VSHINVGCGKDLTIAELAQLISMTVGYRGKITWDTTKPDGAPRKWMDSKRIESMGWKARIGLEEGLAIAYEDFLTQA